MIGKLTGAVVLEEADGTIIVDVGGVGYEVMVPAGALGRIRAQAAETGAVTLFVHTHVREDAIVLFGFASMQERTTFRILLGVSNIGPRIALGILSSQSPSELARAVQSREMSSLVAIPGVGKKTAERLILELRDKLDFAATTAVPVRVVPKSTSPVAMQVIEALSRMGFKPVEAERAVASLGDRIASEPLDEVFRQALTLLRH